MRKKSNRFESAKYDMSGCNEDNPKNSLSVGYSITQTNNEATLADSSNAKSVGVGNVKSGAIAVPHNATAS